MSSRPCGNVRDSSNSFNTRPEQAANGGGSSHFVTSAPVRATDISGPSSGQTSLLLTGLPHLNPPLDLEEVTFSTPRALSAWCDKGPKSAFAEAESNLSRRLPPVLPIVWVQVFLVSPQNLQSYDPYARYCYDH